MLGGVQDVYLGDVRGVHRRGEAVPFATSRARRSSGGRVITTMVTTSGGGTWAGYRASATLPYLTDSVQRFDDASTRMRTDLTLEMWKTGTADAAERLCLNRISGPWRG
jgi:hypothetical protein